MKVISEMPLLVVALLALGVSAVSAAPSYSSNPSSGEEESSSQGPLLSTFKGIHREFIQHPDGVYRFSFSLPQQDRYENRGADGKVSGSFSFVDNSGEEVSLKYDADEEGFRPESDALPEVPEDTDDVQSAREEFLRYYEQTVKFLKEMGSDEDDDSDDSSSSSEESDEYDDEDEEEGDGDDDDDEEEDEDEDEEDDSSSEEDSDESSSEEDSNEEDSEEEDEEDDEEEEEEDDDEEEEGEGEEEEEEEEETEDSRSNIFSFSPQKKFNRGFGSRVRQQDLSRTAAPAKKVKKAVSRAVFPPLPASVIFW